MAAHLPLALHPQDPLGNTSTNRYYADGLLEKTTNPNGHDTTYVYHTCCGAGEARLITVVDADLNTIQYLYDFNGNRTRVTHRAGRVVAYQYDGLNRQTKMTVDPAGLNLQTVTDYNQTPGVIGRTGPVAGPATVRR